MVSNYDKLDEFLAYGFTVLAVAAHATNVGVGIYKGYMDATGTPIENPYVVHQVVTTGFVSTLAQGAVDRYLSMPNLLPFKKEMCNASKVGIISSTLVPLEMVVGYAIGFLGSKTFM